jgi:hypothetical protein
MKLTIHETPRRNCYLRIYGSEVKDWPTFANYIYHVFGKMPDEDNTVGQLCQEEHIKNSHHCMGSVNLYGMSIRPILKSIKDYGVSIELDERLA